MPTCSCNLFGDDPTEDIAELTPSFDEGAVDAGHHLPVSHLTLLRVAPIATPEGAFLDTPAQPRVSPVSTQVPSGTATDTTLRVTGTSPGDTQVPSLEASVTRPIQSGANLVGTQPSSRLSSRTLPAQPEVVFSGTLVPSWVASLDTYRDSTEMTHLAISAQSEVAPLNTPVPSEPILYAPEPKIELDTVIQEIIEHCKTTDIGNNPVKILRYMHNRLALGRALDVVDPAQCSKGYTSYILVDRNILETSFEEIITNKFLTLEVQFYNEVCYVLYCTHLAKETLTM